MKRARVYTVRELNGIRVADWCDYLLMTRDRQMDDWNDVPMRSVRYLYKYPISWQLINLIFAE